MKEAAPKSREERIHLGLLKLRDKSRELHAERDDLIVLETNEGNKYAIDEELKALDALILKVDKKIKQLET